jgi:hypothetical protein
MTRVALSIAIGFVLTVPVRAGSLEPAPGPPAPTMVTAKQIIDALGAAKTGQTTCWDATGNVVPCAGTGQDGALQKGSSVPQRFTDNGDGTVRDNLTGLFWLKNANCFGSALDWTTALNDSKTLASGSCGLTDGSTAGTWRLPNVKELYSLSSLAQINPALPPGHPFANVASTQYWTSTTNASSTGQALYVGFNVASINTIVKTSAACGVWPVRDR